MEVHELGLRSPLCMCLVPSMVAGCLFWFGSFLALSHIDGRVRAAVPPPCDVPSVSSPHYSFSAFLRPVRACCKDKDGKGCTE